jgi:hypothetical protein
LDVVKLCDSIRPVAAVIFISEGCGGHLFWEKSVKCRSLFFLLGLLWVLVCPQSALAAAEKETWLGLPVEFVNQGYALKNGVAVELSNVKVFTTIPIEMKQVWITPDWADWMTKFRSSRVRVTANEIVARPSSLTRLGTIDGPSTRVISRVRFNKLKLLFGASALELPEGEMRFRADGALSVIRVEYEHGVTVELSPEEGGKLSLLVQMGGVKWPVLPAFSFESVAAQGTLSDDTVDFQKIGASGPEGALSGSMRLVSAGKMLLEGHFKMEGVHASDIIARLYQSSVVNGYLNGSFQVNASGDSIDSLAQAVAINGEYVLKTGSIDKFGLLEGMRRRSSGPVGGGLVQFESITGKFSGKTGQVATVEFQGMDSGALRGSSAFSIQPDGRLKGAVWGSMLLPGGESISRSFELGGRANAPMLFWR